MKQQELWLNLPVKDLVKAKAFFSALGFKSLREVPNMIGFEIGQVPVMMVLESQFQMYSGHVIADTSQGSEILISIDAPSKKYVNAMAEKVKVAGGEVFSEPQAVQGWMYNMGFIDLDGHRWNVLYMDSDNMQTE